MQTYTFQSNRLGFRNWTMNDLDELYAINSDDIVMEFFPFKPSKKSTKDFINRMQQQYTEKGFCYFAVDILETNEFIGFIGLSQQDYLEDPRDFIDIGWRLKKECWNLGYATEGAKACLNFGFDTIGLRTIYSVAPETNLKSEHIMKKIGMSRTTTFEHPKLKDYKDLVSCVLYQKKK